MLPIITSLSIVALRGTLSLIVFSGFPSSDGFFPDNRSDAAFAKISSSSAASLMIYFYNFIRIRIKYKVKNSIVSSNKKMISCFYNQIILILYELQNEHKLYELNLSDNY